MRRSTRECATNATPWRCRRPVDGDTASSVLAEFLGLHEGLDLGVKAVYLDSEFYDGKCLTLLHAHNFAYITLIIRWGDAIKDELSRGWSRTVEHDLTTEFDGHEWTVEFPVYIDCTYQNGRYNEHGVARHGYAADAPFIETPRQARSHYRKRFGIESSYSLSERRRSQRRHKIRCVGCCSSRSASCFRTPGGTCTGSTWRRPAAAGIASGSGCSRSSSTW